MSAMAGDIVRVAYDDGSRDIGVVMGIMRSASLVPRALVMTPTGVWRGPARDALVVKTRDEVREQVGYRAAK